MAQSQNRRNTWEGPNGRSAEAKATELLHLYIYDYCKKKKFVQAARAFSSEANVPTDQVPPFESSTGFLADWWSVFWDIYFAKSKEAEASKEANIMDEYHSFLRTKKEEVLQQQRAFNLQQAQQQAQQQQQQQVQAQQQAQLQAQQQAQQQAQRRASEAQRAAQSPQLSVHQQQQQQDQQQTPHLQQQSVPSQQQQQQQAQQQQQQQLSRDVRPSPASSTASLPNNNGMPPPPNNNNNIVNTPQSMPANLPQQHIPGRHTASPSFSPQQLQRGVEVVPGGGGPHPPQPQPSNLGPEGMMTSPMVNQQMPMQQSMMTAAHRAQQQSAIVNAAMNSVGLGGRDQSSLTHEEKIILQNQIRKISMNQQMNMMRNNPMLANNPQAQARLQMQQQAILQQQQQAQQQAMLQQQHLQQQQQQQQHAQQQQGMPPQHAQQQQQPQGTPQQQHQMQQQQGTPQQQQAQLPPHTPQQQHPMGQSPQVDPAQRMGPVGPPVNGQPRPHMVGPGGQMGMNPNMQSPNLMNGGIPFNGDVNLMLAQQMMNKGQMPAGLTPQQQQQHQQQMLVAQQQRAIMNQRRMMQQQQAQQAQQAQQQQQQQQNQGAGPQQQQQPPLPPSSAGGQPHSQQPTPQQQPQQLPPGQGANGGPQTPPNMGSPNPAAIPGSGSPEGGDKKKNIAVALYQRRQVHHAMQQQQQAQQQAQFAHPPPQKRQRTNNGEDASATTPQQMQQSPQLQHKMSPHVMNAQQQPNPNESPVMAMQQRLAAQQRSQFEQQQQQQQMNSPQLTRNSISGTPQQQQQQLHQQQQQRMSWNPDMDSPMNDMQSPANNMNNPGGMAAAANAAAAAAAANVAAQNNNNNNNAMSNSNVLSFDLERFMMGDSGDFGEMFAAGDENPDQNLLMGGDGADLDPFGGGFLASMGGGLDLDNGMTGNNGASGGAPASHAINMNANTALQPYADLPGHTNKVSTAAFSIDGQWLASAGHDRKVMIWSVQDKKTLYTLDGHTGNITCARWSSDNRNLVATTSYDKTLRIWDVGSALAALASKDDKDDDDSKTDSTTTNPKQLAKWDCRAQVTAVDFAPDRPDTICSLDAEGELKVWNLNTSNCEKSLKMTQSKSGFAPNPMRFHPRTASVLACAVGNQINIIDITSSGKNNSGNNNNNNSNNIINADNMGVRTIPTDHGKNICSFDWSSDGNFLVASSEDKICVYETSHWKCVMNHIPQSKISGCAFVNGGNEKLRLLYGGYQDIFLWQCGIPGAQPKKVGSQSGMVVSIACCSVASGQTLVASASHHQKEKNLMLWTI